MNYTKPFYLLAIILGISLNISGQQTSFVNDNCSFILPQGTNLVLSDGVGLINQNLGTIVNEGNIYVSGDWNNAGVADIGDGYVHFNGTTQAVSGNTNFNYVNIDASSTTTMVSGTQAVKSILKCDGTLNADGHLTLLSVASAPDVVRTGLIDGSGTGNILGTVTQQRTIPSSRLVGYKHYSSAFQDATFGQMGAFINLILGSLTTFPTPTVMKFHEPNAHSYFNSGWTPAAPAGGLTYTIEPSVGYAVQFGNYVNQTKLTQLSGTVNNGPFTIDVHKSSSSVVAGNGWNLLGNPYPSPIDLGKLDYGSADLVKSAAIYVSTTMYNGTYGYFNATINMSLSGGAKYLPALHGFFVQKVNMGTNQFQFTNNARSTQLVSPNVLNALVHYKDYVDFGLIKLSASRNVENSIADELAIMFLDDATEGFDGDYDATKIFNTDPLVPNFYSISEGMNYAFNGLKNDFSNSSVIPLGFSIQTTGEYTINAVDILNIPSNTTVLLEDVAKGKVQDLNMNPQYTFNADKNEPGTGRFYLRISNTSTDIEDASNQEIYQAWASGNTLFVSYNNPLGTSGKVKVMNLLGQQILQEQTINNGLHQFNLMQPTGYYLVNFVSENSSKTTKIFINN